MVRIAIQTAFVAAVIGFASALVTEQRAPPLVKASLKKVNTITDSKNIVARDLARLNGYFKQNAISERQDVPVINEIFSYIAATKVGTQTFDLIIDTVCSSFASVHVCFVNENVPHRAPPTPGLVLVPSSLPDPRERAPARPLRSRTALDPSRESIRVNAA
jgi:hypothetical protein